VAERRERRGIAPMSSTVAGGGGSSGITARCTSAKARLSYCRVSRAASAA
jgi:hypothetical protein